MTILSGMKNNCQSIFMRHLDEIMYRYAVSSPNFHAKSLFFTTKDTKNHEGMRKLIVEEFYLFTLTSYLIKTSCPFVFFVVRKK